jgi:GAF domain-containing protein
MSARIPASQVHFLSLQTAIFCVQCELIGANNTSYCLACGSKAVLGISRLLGGSLRGQASARLIEDDELNRLVRQLLVTLPGSQRTYEEDNAVGSLVPAQQERCGTESTDAYGGRVFPIQLEPAIGVITERAQVLTGASGAAIALRRGEEVICRARAGRTAPDIGVRLQTDSGISAECLRSGEVVLCNDSHTSPRADRATCERLGVRSILAAPLRQLHRTLGIFEVLSPSPNAFDTQDVATLQLLSSMMVTAITRLSRITPAATQ